MAIRGLDVHNNNEQSGVEYQTPCNDVSIYNGDIIATCLLRSNLCRLLGLTRGHRPWMDLRGHRK